jgi:AcrR family transcriptional regulator
MDLFASRSYKATTVRDIADEAGLLSGSLYHHFDSKESILDEALSGLMDFLIGTYRAVADEPSAGPEETFEKLTRAAFSALDEHRSAITVLQNERHYLEQFSRFSYLLRREEEIQRIWTRVIQEGIAEGNFRDDLGAKFIYRFVRDAVWPVGSVGWVHDRRLNPARLTELYLSVILHGICPG